MMQKLFKPVVGTAEDFHAARSDVHLKSMSFATASRMHGFVGACCGSRESCAHLWPLIAHKSTINPATMCCCMEQNLYI